MPLGDYHHSTLIHLPTSPFAVTLTPPYMSCRCSRKRPLYASWRSFYVMRVLFHCKTCHHPAFSAAIVVTFHPNVWPLLSALSAAFCLAEIPEPRMAALPSAVQLHRPRWQLRPLLLQSIFSSSKAGSLLPTQCRTRQRSAAESPNVREFPAATDTFSSF